MSSFFSTPGKLMAFLCLLILAGTSACTDSDVGPGATSRLRDQPADDLSEVGNIAPIRVVYDQYPMFAGVAVDPASNKVFLSDDNTFSVLEYTADNPGSPDRITEFAHRIVGPSTRIHSACGIAIDPESQEIYVLNTDGADNMVVFGYGQSGDTAPLRELKVDHGGWGMYLDHNNYSELFFTIQHLNKISVYRPDAEGREVPHRYIQGPKTKLVDPHGIFVDTVNDEIVVTNHHSAHAIATGVVANTLGFRHALQSTGHYELSSVTVYSRTAEGDVAPLRIIQGPKTRLNLPLGVVVDTERNVILVANDQSHIILAFSRTAQGNVAPLYTIEGPATGLRNPGAFFLDTKNDELWVTNWGDHSVNIFPADARGNVAPARVIRTAPKGEPVAGLGRPSSVSWDSRRDELLVPNWVSHPRIAAYARLANGNADPTRVIEGEKAGLARALHGIVYDKIHDEIIAPNPFAESISFFRGGANGEEPPIRIIQGPNTQLDGGPDWNTPDSVAYDPTYDEVFTRLRRGHGEDAVPAILVFPRTGNGDIKPLRVLRGPKTLLLNPYRIAVDGANNMLVIANQDPPGFLIFDRDADGDVAPRQIISGPNTGIYGNPQQIQMDPERKQFIAAIPGGRRPAEGEERAPGFVGVWNYTDDGDVAPTHVIRGSRIQMTSPRGMDFNPEAKEVYVADFRQNKLYTFYAPHFFEEEEGE